MFTALYFTARTPYSISTKMLLGKAYLQEILQLEN